MITIKLSATKARNNFFELLNQVATGTQVIIERDNKEVATLSSKKSQINWREFRKAAEGARGILVNDKVDLNDNPLRKSGAADFLGTWDK
jgi:prevent-host-death family protein